MAEAIPDPSGGDEDRSRDPSEPRSFLEILQRFSEEERYVEWEGAKCYRLCFDDGSTRIIVTKGNWSAAKRLSVSEDCEVIPEIVEVKTPFYQAFRIDRLVHVTEILPGDILSELDPKKPTE